MNIARTRTSPEGRKRRRGQDSGQIAGIEVLPFGFLLFVAVVLVVANAWAVIDAKMAVSAAAREAARTLVESDPADAFAAADARALEVLAAYGRDDPSRTTIEPPLIEGGTFGRCARVTVTVSYEVPAVVVPFIGGLGDGFTATASHSELIDPYRDGDFEGSCSP